jgi:hypothetical protein
MRVVGVELAFLRNTITRKARKNDITERIIINLIWASAELINYLIYYHIIREIK